MEWLFAGVALAMVLGGVFLLTGGIRPLTPHEYVRQGDAKKLEQWLTRGHPDAADPSGFTLLMSAAAHDRPKMAQRLILAGASLDAAEQEGATALYIATVCGHREVVRVLLAAGASPNRVNDLGSVPLHAAVAKPEAQAVLDDLLAAGAELDFKNAWGVTPLQLALNQGLDDVTDKLRAAGAQLSADVRMEDVLVRLSEADRAAYRLPRAWGVPPDDPRLVAAKERARAELLLLDEALDNDLPCRVKFIRREQPEYAGESLWGRVRYEQHGGYDVELISMPAGLELDPFQRVDRDEVVDWEVDRPDGSTDGGFTAKVTDEVVADEFGRFYDALKR